MRSHGDRGNRAAADARRLENAHCSWRTSPYDLIERLAIERLRGREPEQGRERGRDVRRARRLIKPAGRDAGPEKRSRNLLVADLRGAVAGVRGADVPDPAGPYARGDQPAEVRGNRA